MPISPNPTGKDVHPTHPPVVPIPQDPFIPTGRLQRLVNAFPGGQFLRYLCVGVFNTLFGYATFALLLFLLNRAVPARYLYLTVVAASILSTPLNITVAYFGYKFFVFKTRGNYLIEWFKCFGVYGIGMLPGLFALSSLTGLIQHYIHATSSSGKPLAGYIAGAITTAFSTIFSFIGHKKVTFATKP